MGTGWWGTFAIAWQQTEIDGAPTGSAADLAIGATWRWSGQATRIDGPQDVVTLDAGARADAGMRRARAASRAQRLAGGSGAAPAPAEPGPPALPRGGFAVTDGRQLWPASVLDAAGGRPLVAFSGRLPPRDVELWIAAVDPLARLPRPAPVQAVVCFTRGTRLATPAGPVAVEDLQPGDRIATRDDGPQPVLWVGNSRITGARLHLCPELRPVRIRAAALGDGIPDGELVVSPQHRVLLAGAAARSLFNETEVLVAAADLIDDARITRIAGLPRLDYFHLLLPRHQVVWGNAVATETFHPAQADLARLDPAQLQALTTALPGVVEDPALYGAPARRMLGRAEAALLRHDLRRLGV